MQYLGRDRPNPILTKFCILIICILDKICTVEVVDKMRAEIGAASPVRLMNCRWYSIVIESIFLIEQLSDAAIYVAVTN